MPLSKIDSDSLNTPITAADLAYTGTLTGSTGIVNIGSGQVYKDASGNVGIGVTPTSAFQVAKESVIAKLKSTSDNSTYLQIEANNGGGSAFYVGQDSSTGGSFGKGAYAAVVLQVGAYPITFWTNNSERARIDSSGNLLVGTTTDNITAVGVRLRGDNIQVAKSGDWSLRVGRTTSTGIIQEIYYNSSRVGDIATNGSNTTYNSASDYRLKENVQPMENALAKVTALKPVTFTWKSTGTNDDGFLAHELQSVVPHAVRGEKDEMNADGEPVYQSIDTSVLVATLTAAIQELKAIVDAQGAEIAALKGTP